MSRDPSNLIYLGLPTYAGHPWFRSIYAGEFASDKYHVTRNMYGCSLIPKGFGEVWCNALDGEHTHFAMLHDDVAADRGWLDVLVGELELRGLSVLSAVVPMKTQAGITSTAIQTGGDWDNHKRLTVREIEALPQTFTADDCGYPGHSLLINTGCWVARIRQTVGGALEPWADAFPGFQITSRIEKRTVKGELRRCVAINPEDWAFSRWLHNNNVPYAATKLVQTIHRGFAEWDSWSMYGDEIDKAWESEQAAKSLPETIGV